MSKHDMNPTIRFRYERSTRNMYRFQEVDVNGDPLDRAECTIGTLYIRKRVFEADKPPMFIGIRIASLDLD